MYERGTRAGQLTDRQERGIGFPECNDPATVDSIIRQRIPGIRPRDLATVRKRQPCRYAPRNRPLHVLPNLRRFSNTDKHRTLEVLYGLPTGGMMQITEQRDCEVPTKTRKAPTVPLQVGTEVGVIHAIKTGPHPEIDVEVTLSVQPAIHPRITVIAWMDKTRTWVASLLLALQRPAPTDRLVAIGVPRHLIP
jgi:hypothetical protein